MRPFPWCGSTLHSWQLHTGIKVTPSQCKTGRGGSRGGAAVWTHSPFSQWHRNSNWGLFFKSPKQASIPPLPPSPPCLVVPPIFFLPLPCPSLPLFLGWGKAPKPLLSALAGLCRELDSVGYSGSDRQVSPGGLCQPRSRHGPATATTTTITAAISAQPWFHVQPSWSGAGVVLEPPPPCTTSKSAGDSGERSSSSGWGRGGTGRRGQEERGCAPGCGGEDSYWIEKFKVPAAVVCPPWRGHGRLEALQGSHPCSTGCCSCSPLLPLALYKILDPSTNMKWSCPHFDSDSFQGVGNKHPKLDFSFNS